MSTNKERIILVVDDEQEVRLMLSHLFCQAGYNTLEAADGKEAVEIIRKKLPDLVVIDLMMPVMNGVEATKEIRKLMGGDSLPIIALTAYDLHQLVLPEEEKQLWQEILKKPISIKRLRTVVAEMLGSRSLEQHNSQN
ncbi:MAG: response regulator [Acidobacteriota bacterium]